MTEHREHREIHIGPPTRDHAPEDKPAHHGETSTFDREISLKGITWTGVGLVAMVVVSAVLMWWLLRGFQTYDERRDVRPSPIEAANPQQPPPAPRLQVAPGFAVLNDQGRGKPLERSDGEDMQAEREAEDKALSQPSWIDQGQGTVRVPIETAMQVIARRGLAPLSSATGAAPPPPPAPEERRPL